LLPTPGGAGAPARLRPDCQRACQMGGDRLEAVGIALQVGPVPGLAEIQEPGGSRGQKRSPSGAEGSPGACHIRWWVREPAPVSRSAQIHFRELPYRFGARPKTRVLLLCRPRGRWMEAPRPDAGDARPRLATNARPRRVDDQAHHSSCDCPVGHARGLTPPSWTPARAAPCEQFYADRRRELAQGSANHRLRQ
jgi:hypothetical protein